jgi:hypothetical protein
MRNLNLCNMIIEIHRQVPDLLAGLRHPHCVTTSGDVRGEGGCYSLSGGLASVYLLAFKGFVENSVRSLMCGNSGLVLFRHLVVATDSGHNGREEH